MPEKMKYKRPLKARKNPSRPKTVKENTPRPKKAEKVTPLKVIPLGGVGEIGKNMTVLEYGNDIVVLDCGMTFPGEELLGVDLVIQDTSYLLKNREKIKGVIITHAHEDHIGALPYFLRDFNVPIFCTALTAGLVKLRIAEHKNLKKVDFRVKSAGDKFKLGVFDVEMIHVNHSVPDSVALSINTPVGLVLFTGDFKIDNTPPDGKMTDLTRIGELGKKGVKLLLMDSTNAEREGTAMSERLVSASIEREFKDCSKRIIISCFSSNVHRIQKIIEVSEKNGRRVVVSGRSMENILKVGSELGYIKAGDKTITDINAVKRMPPEKVVILTTGSQGEPMSALYRMAYGSHKQIEIGAFDKILLAASPIPGNEKSVYGMINELVKRGAEVVYERLSELHVSGHACREELKMMLSLAKPRYFMPLHGEYRHLKANFNLAVSCGMNENNIFLTDLGKVLEVTRRSARFNGTVPSGRVLVDGYGVGDVGNAVLRERRAIGQDGVIVAYAAVDLKKRKILSSPGLTSRGFVFVKEAEELMNELQRIVKSALEAAMYSNTAGEKGLKDAVSSALSDYLFKKTHRTPEIIPVISVVDNAK